MEVDLTKHSYCIVIPCYDGKLNMECILGVIETTQALLCNNIRHQILAVRGSALIDATRNELAHRFLHETDCDTMVTIDSDIGFDWKAFERLAVWSHHYPVVGGVYCGRVDPPKFVVTHCDNKLNEHGLLPVKAVGIGFTAVQREVFDKLDVPSYKHAQYGSMKAFFWQGVQDGVYYGEDIAFLRECLKVGLQPMVDPGIELKHVGTKVFDYQFKDCVHQLLGDKNVTIIPEST